ncbi:MAG: ABC transporter substrate-binding protein [Bryobacteraceae bacterium]|jgi:putative ABC transport system substrate-binding protein
MGAARNSRNLIRRLAVFVLIAGLLACDRGPAHTVTIFTLQPYPILDDSIRGIRQALQKQGFDSARLRITEVNANGQTNLLDGYAREILQAHPDVVVPVSTPVAKAVLKEARAQAGSGPLQPIVFSTVTNPNDADMDKHPPNVTGVSDQVNYEANIALIRELFPKATRVGIIYNPSEANSQYGVDKIREIAKRENLTLRVITVGTATEVPDAARAILQTVDAVYVGSDNTVTSAMPGLVAVCTAAKLPVVASDSGSVENGAVAAVSVDYVALGESAGDIVARILKTKAAPGSIQNVLFFGKTLLLNERTAEKLGFTFPPAVKGRAAKVLR